MLQTCLEVFVGASYLCAKSNLKNVISCLAAIVQNCTQFRESQSSAKQPLHRMLSMLNQVRLAWDVSRETLDNLLQKGPALLTVRELYVLEVLKDVVLMLEYSMRNESISVLAFVRP